MEVSFKTPPNLVVVSSIVWLIVSLVGSLASITSTVYTMSQSVKPLTVHDVRSQAVPSISREPTRDFDFRNWEKRLSRMEVDLNEIRFKILPAVMAKLDTIQRGLDIKPTRQSTSARVTVPTLMSDVY
uniref:Uncharacterized protein n=1 Tax=Mogami virus TaxID=2170597 RepID=A0A2S0S4P0_9VIRU|nr:hypothetical protein [Mogami virus]